MVVERIEAKEGPWAYTNARYSFTSSVPIHSPCTNSNSAVKLAGFCSTTVIPAIEPSRSTNFRKEAGSKLGFCTSWTTPFRSRDRSRSLDSCPSLGSRPYRIEVPPRSKRPNHNSPTLQNRSQRLFLLTLPLSPPAVKSQAEDEVISPLLFADTVIYI